MNLNKTSLKFESRQFAKVSRLPFLLLLLIPLSLYAQDKVTLKNDKLELTWAGSKEGFRLRDIKMLSDGQLKTIAGAMGEYTFLYSKKKPDIEPDWSAIDHKSKGLIESSYKLITNRWRQNLDPVAMNTAGQGLSFYPSSAYKKADSIVFDYVSDKGQIKSTWTLDDVFRNDILVEIALTAAQSGYFSIGSPALISLDKKKLTWGMIPGHFQGKELTSDLLLGYGYGQGIPDRPIVARERTATTLSPLVSSRDGFTLAVIPQPGTARDPWTSERNTQNDWLLGLSLINRNSILTPTIYHPVLGEKGSYLNEGERRVFRFRYTLTDKEWFDVYKHAVNDIYKFPNFISLKNTKQSLTNRILGMSRYLSSDSASLWHIHQYKGLPIGAQEYNGAVFNSDKDALKNSDYGAMWMLAAITGDSVLTNHRLPFARNFKLAQQETEDEFFKGAVNGQYFLWKSKHFTEEWGDYVEPIAVTYYTMLDIGNILLFQPEDKELKERLRLGADRLLAWQHRQGNWDVAYDKQTKQPIFTDLKDLRPTFYGLIVAYKLLSDKKYLDAARKGADWFIDNAVENGHFLGVCGDFRFVTDFATGQSVQALLDLYEITGHKKYQEAAIKTGRLYLSSIYTHPIPDTIRKNVNGAILQDWEISQVGLNVEHGGTLGSAAKSNGPILLASHAGMFIRLYDLTKDSLYLNMARAAAWGRDAFVNEANSVASYYWSRMDSGPGAFPHHAWWQVGWIMDYLISEISSRTSREISFPKGFITPKVGPHVTYGFEPGVIFGIQAELYLNENFVKVNNEKVDFIGAISKERQELYVVLINNSTQNQLVEVRLQNNPGFADKPTHKITLVDHLNNIEKEISADDRIEFSISPVGLKVLKIAYK